MNLSVFLIAAAVFLFVLGVVGYFGYRTYAKAVKLVEKLATPPPGMRDLAPGGFASGVAQTPTFQVRRGLQWIGEKLPISPEEASVTGRMLLSAGYRTEYAVAVFQAIRVITALGFFAAAAGLAAATNWIPLADAVVIVVCTGIGFWLPQLVLEEILIPRYQESLRFALPDALDMLVVCVEAGISLDQAIRMVSEELELTHPTLCRELKLISVEMRAGERRVQALKNLAERTREPEISKLVALLVQTDRFGTSVGDALRTHSEFMRVARRQEAQERAGKLGVKLVIPIFFFILPTIVILTAVPPFIQILTALKPGNR